MQLTGILACLVVAEETADNHSAESVLVLVGHNLKVAHQVVGEVVLRHLVEQLVLIDRIGLVSQQEYVIDVQLYAERIDMRRVLCHSVSITQMPYVA